MFRNPFSRKGAPKIIVMLLPAIRLLVIISMVASQPALRKHWKRAPVHGTFNVDAYAYNKPQVNLVQHLPAAARTGEVLPMVQLLEHLSHSSRALDQQDSKPDTDYQAGSGKPALKATALAALNSQLAKLQMNFSSTHAGLYSHEFHVQNMGNRKIVLLNTLERQQQQHEKKEEEKEDWKETRKPDSTEITSKQNQPLNVKLALPELHSSKEEQEQQVQKPITTETKETTDAISSTEIEPSNARQKSVAAEQQQLSDVTVGIAKRGKDVSNATTIKRDTTGGNLKLKTIVDAKRQQEQQMQNQYQLQQTREKLGMDSPVDSPTDNDGQATGLRESLPVVVVEGGDKPSRSKSKRKQTKTQTQTQAQTKTPNEIDTKLTATSAAPPVDMLMSATANVSIRNPQQQQKQQQKNSQVRSKGERGKGKRKGAVGQEQEIETTTNWWHILPYAEIRKFLNTIYDSITDEDSDDERAAPQRI